ncbi:hypothetical protein QBC39DRAFT_402775 [Podospora conica]|nr:hypothetical protein QBC39DRAFT_402775 [Schizothecium conicum]
MATCACPTDNFFTPVIEGAKTYLFSTAPKALIQSILVAINVLFFPGLILGRILYPIQSGVLLIPDVLGWFTAPGPGSDTSFLVRKLSPFTAFSEAEHGLMLRGAEGTNLITLVLNLERRRQLPSHNQGKWRLGRMALVVSVVWLYLVVCRAIFAYMQKMGSGISPVGGAGEGCPPCQC